MARPLLLLAIVSPLLAQTQTCQGGACPPLPHRIAERLAERLSDEELATTILELLNACDGRTNCAQSMEQQAAAAVELNRSRDALDVPPATAEVNGMDTRMPSTGFRLLFGTPLFSTTLEHAEQLNDELAELIDHEQRDAAGARRSMAGEASFRTDDHFLQRPEAAVRSLHSALLVHAERALQYGQPRRLRLELELHGWAISHGHGGSQVPHVHPIAQWSGVYYVRVPRRVASGGAGGCLRVTDPRPAAMMVTLGANDQQFLEARTVCPTPGLLVLFPSWLSHSVDRLDEGALDEGERRVAVAFNVHGWERPSKE